MNITANDLKNAVRNDGVSRTDSGAFRVEWENSYGASREAVLSAAELRPLMADAAGLLGRTEADLTAELNSLPSPVDPDIHPDFGRVLDRKTRAIESAGWLGTGAGVSTTRLVLVDLDEDFVGYHSDDTEVVSGTGYKAGDRIWVRDHAPTLQMI